MSSPIRVTSTTSSVSKNCYFQHDENFTKKFLAVYKPVFWTKEPVGELLAKKKPFNKKIALELIKEELLSIQQEKLTDKNKFSATYKALVEMKIVNTNGSILFPASLGTMSENLHMKIFSNLNLKEEALIAQVSANFNSILPESRRRKTWLKITPNQNIIGVLKLHIRREGSQSVLEHLDISGSIITIEISNFIATNLQNLKTLNFSDCQITDAELKYLTFCPKLEHLNLTRCNKITDVGLKHISLCPQLQYLELFACREITDVGLGYLTSSCPKLEHLGLHACRKITDLGFEHLASSCPNLKILNVARCNKITDLGVKYFSLCPLLQTLNLAHCKITDAGLEHIISCTQLQTLWLVRCKQITDAGVKYLSACTQLKTLYLEGCEQITDAGVKYLSACTQLETLELNFCKKVTKAGAREHLSRLPYLKELGLFSCQDSSFSSELLGPLGPTVCTHLLKFFKIK